MMTAELWRTTGRWDKNGSEMIKFKDRKGEEYCLGPTHEELITQIVANDVFSYKNLPLRLYQIGASSYSVIISNTETHDKTGEKFRDEVRPRHGLIRCREFIMKDMYSFDATQELALKTYEELVKAYHRIMKR
jgi:prolyl-tRNA synthetase